MNKLIWTKEEDQFLIENYKKIGMMECARQLNKPKSCIFRQFQLLVFNDKNHGTKQLTNTQIEFIKINYPKLGSVQCGQELGISKFQVEILAGNLKLKRDFNTAPDGFKICAICKETKLETEFNWSKLHQQIRKCQCRNCDSLYQFAYQRRRLEDSNYRMLRAKKQLLSGSKNRARKKGIEFNLDFEWIEQNLKETCPVTEIKFHFADGTGKIHPHSPSIDRINNKLGYLKSNCVIVCSKVNTAKGTCNCEELEKISNFYKNLNNKNIIEDYSI